ncbi:hypothetical protein AOC36_09075 [Erysipelothrix larvae]|uniref:Peptidase M20 dimerisation domain-containing protein n=1 Tax=Erysipelothrix larvae TaxID=1514105 RepID=A0A0X8H119_9FIRM|nr:M20/M25/M40 family metallo-hydrolase [Erysipelothrix larvae]AMC94134.1 hypothetical protein AOC36_09075 [Erysipelothrix larvae]
MNTDRMTQSFMELVGVASVSRHEGVFHDVLKKKLIDLGLELNEDSSRTQTGLGGNNLVFTLKGNCEGTPLFFSAHTDTVQPGEGIVPILDQGIITSQGHTILGADDKAGIAIIIELIQTIQEEHLPHPTLEFVFTPGEEIGLVGASALDMSTIHAHYGIVLDSDGPVGGITCASPTLITLETEITGKSAHAGLEPEKGISAIKVLAEIISQIKMGRLDEITTVNVGVIKGGSATNVVAEKATMKAEVRSIDHQVCLNEIASITQIIDAVTTQYGAHHHTTTQQLSTGYRFTQTMPFIGVIDQAIKANRCMSRYVISGGGSDANVFNAHGKQCVNIAIGYEKIHTVDEMIPVSQMETCVGVCLDIIDRMRGFKDES